MVLRVISAPGAEPVSLAEAKAQCRAADFDDDDAEISAMIVAARTRAETVLRRRLITQTLEFRCSGLGRSLRLPIAPIQSISSITYLDTANVQQTLATDQYRLDISQVPSRIVPAYLSVWPSVLPDVDTVAVQFVAGYGDTGADVPADIKAAVLMLIGHFYKNREATSATGLDEMPLGPRDLLLPHVVWV